VALLCFKDSFLPAKAYRTEECARVSIIAEQPHPRKGETSKDGDPDNLYLQYYLPINLVLVRPAMHRTPSQSGCASNLFIGEEKDALNRVILRCSIDPDALRVHRRPIRLCEVGKIFVRERSKCTFGAPDTRISRAMVAAAPLLERSLLPGPAAFRLA
jgi:hypothetical protein